MTDDPKENEVTESTEATSANGQVGEIDLANIDPSAVVKAIGEMSDEQLREGLQSPMRGQIIGEVFNRMEEHFKPETAQGVDAVVHWNITGGPEGAIDRYEIVVREGTVGVNREMAGSPRVTLTLDGVDFMRLVTGNAQGPQLFMGGKLKLEGDMMFAANIAGMFKIPS